MAEAVLVALELHDDLPRAGIGITATEIGLPRRTLQHALQNEGVSYRDIVLELRMGGRGSFCRPRQRPLPKWRCAPAIPTPRISTAPFCR